jgi:hypothetical protein
VELLGAHRGKLGGEAASASNPREAMSDRLRENARGKSPWRGAPEPSCIERARA